MKKILAVIATALCALPNHALGYLVGPPVNLAKLSEEADLIFKATAISSAVVRDDWFKPVQAFEPWETEFKIVSLVKGAAPGQSLRFRHYDFAQKRTVWMYEPQYYHFEPGQTYLVFAKQGDSPGICRQIWASHTGKQDQGALRCADSQPVTAPTVKAVVWSELKALMLSPSASDRTYGTKQMDQMSVHPKRFDATNDFDHADVLKLTATLMSQTDPEAARAAITVIGSGNPYLADDQAAFWLGTIGGVGNPGLGKMDPKMKNLGGELYWSELCAIADNGKTEGATRALAIRALGLVRNAALVPSIHRWLHDSEPAVRASASLLLADFPGDDSATLVTGMVADAAPEVRRCAATTLGFMQQMKLVALLGTLLGDKDRDVQSAATMSLLSFSPRQEPVASVLKQHLDDEAFHPLFLNALAGETPEPYLERLGSAVELQWEPKIRYNGQEPAFTAWRILFNYLLAQSKESLRSGKFDRYLKALEKGCVTGSSEPTSIYALYVQSGMTERAKTYRAAATKAAEYNLNIYLDMADKDPSPYTTRR